MVKRHNAQKYPGKTTYVLRGGKMVPVRSTVKNRNVLGAGWPKWSTALGCPLSDWPELEKTFAKHGVSAEYDPKRKAVKVESPGHQARLAKACGMIDFGAGLSGNTATNEHYEMAREADDRKQFYKDVDAKVAAYEREFGIK